MYKSYFKTENYYITHVANIQGYFYLKNKIKKK